MCGTCGKRGVGICTCELTVPDPLEPQCEEERAAVNQGPDDKGLPTEIFYERRGIKSLRAAGS
jgi:hypothetical protein